MALRKIVQDGDPILTKKSREVTDFGPKLAQLLDDMRETLIDSGGLGLAGPQVGMLRRVALVMDDEDNIIEIINPEIIESVGDVEGAEGCLSFPGVWGAVNRPEWVKVRAQDRNGEWFEAIGDGMTARCFCHEIDHLNGVCFTSRSTRFLSPEEVDEMRGNN